MLSSKKIERKGSRITGFSHTLHSHFFNWQTQFMGHEPNDSKDDKASKEAGEAVTNRHHKCISVKKRREIINMTAQIDIMLIANVALKV